MIIASKHFPRIITGAVLVSVLGTALYLSGPYLFGLLLLFTLVGLWEFYAMVLAAQGQHRRAYPRPCARRPAHHRRMDAPRNGRHDPRPVHSDPRLHVPVLLVARRQVPLYAGRGARRGLLYVPMLIMPALNFSIHEQLLLICTAAGSDTVAYFFGMRFGKHKIWPKVSPKKSVEGSAAGLAASVVVAVCFGLAFGVPATGISDYALLGLVLGVMAQLGDFFESALKRSRSVKDSGNVLPGHGGVLDRVDSLLFVIPTYECARALMTFF